MKTAPGLMFKAFADETRLRVLNMLARRGELCVCDIQAILRCSQPKVSRHLAYLRRAGLVGVRRDGQWKHYSLLAPEGELHRGLVGCLRGCFSEVAVLRKDLEALRRRRARNIACA